VSLTTPEKLRKLQRALYAKAKREPGYRFHFLYDKVWREDLFAHAWALCRKNRGAPGVDGQSFEHIEALGLDRWLGELREEVRTGQYRGQPVRRVMIPKPGGAGERPLGIPTIRDRVVQTAAKLVLEPIFEADFDDAAHGYRPKRGALQAVEKIQTALEEGRTEVVDADLSKYFDTIPHAELLKSVARRVSDRKMLHLVKMWLKAPVEERDERGRRRTSGGKKMSRGTPQGGVISPLLANVYMNRYLKAFRKSELGTTHGAVLVNYADDFVVLCRKGAQQVLDVTRRWMTSIGLALNERKTCVRNARFETFDFLGYTFGPKYSPRTGGRYLTATPSKKALLRLKGNIRAQLRSGNMATEEEVAKRLNRTLRGWASYFCFGTLTKVRHTVDAYVYDRVRHFLRRRRQAPGRATRSIPRDWVFGKFGLLSLESLPKWKWNPVHAKV
jgi:RNA-directed DNA polymerase